MDAHQPVELGALRSQPKSSNLWPDDVLLPLRVKAEAGTEASRCKSVTVVQYGPPCWLTSTPARSRHEVVPETSMH